MSETRKLVIGCDGTWNEPEQTSDGEPAPTNVVKFLRAMKRLSGQQTHYYEKGVGTRAWEAVPGGVYGYGLDKRIQGAYRFLCNKFVDGKWERDEHRVFILGFSRGAYTARRIAGLIHHSGIPSDPADTELGWEMYRERDAKSARALKQSGRFFKIKIEMVGVWDTVKATNDPDYKDQKLSGNVKAGYHAMAIDEKRKSFSILQWEKNRRALQVWFAGVHSDVGGGYAKCGLSDIALNWMIYRAIGHGLRFKANYLDENVDPLSDALIHHSYKGIWKPLGARERKIRKTDFVHRAVEERLEKKETYDPENLPRFPRYWPVGRS